MAEIDTDSCSPSRRTVLGWRMWRQGIDLPATDAASYRRLVERLQPVAPEADAMPGSPPRLLHRVAVDDAVLADDLRSRHQLLKGRFWGGQIGYVLATDLVLYGRAFRKPLRRLNAIQEQVYQALWRGGAMTPRQIKADTGLLNKQIMPALHRLQCAFLVYESQPDSEWERPWSIFTAAWPNLERLEVDAESAAREVLLRFVRSQVFVTLAMLRDWSQLPLRGLRKLLEELVAADRLRERAIDGLGSGWMAAEDRDLPPRDPVSRVCLLHRADPLVRSRMSELKQRFGDREVLQYLLVDGDLRGAVCGHWRIGPHNVDDVVLDLDAAAVAARREEVLATVACHYRAPNSRVEHYAGRPL